MLQRADQPGAWHNNVLFHFFPDEMYYNFEPKIKEICTYTLGEKDSEHHLAFVHQNIEVNKICTGMRPLQIVK